MATHCSILAWKIPWREEPGGLQSMGVTKSRTLQYSCLENSMDRGAWWATVHGGHKESDTPVFLPGKFHGQRSLEGYSPRGHRELDTTERLHFSLKLDLEPRSQMLTEKERKLVQKETSAKPAHDRLPGSRIEQSRNPPCLWPD